MYVSFKLNVYILFKCMLFSFIDVIGALQV